MMRFLKGAFPSDLPRNADESEVVDFLKQQLKFNLY